MAESGIPLFSALAWRNSAVFRSCMAEFRRLPLLHGGMPPFAALAWRNAAVCRCLSGKKCETVSVLFFLSVEHAASSTSSSSVCCVRA
jgi:hypothetical protein